MSLPPETMGLISDFLAALTGLLYVLGGYFLGKWQSDESQATLSTGIKEVMIRMMEMESGRKEVYDIWKQEAYKRGEKLPPLPFADYGVVIFEEKRDLDEDLKKIKRSAQRSKWIGVTCVAVGTTLFVVRLIL